MLATLLLLLIAASLHAPYAFHIYLYNSNPKCFFEELVPGTVAIAEYTAKLWSEQERKWIEPADSGIQIKVEEMETGRVLVNQRGALSGEYRFTAAEAGNHRLCFSSNTTSWFENHTVRLIINTAFSHVENSPAADHEERIDDITKKVRKLNKHLNGIRREQQYQNHLENKFYTTSVRVNRRVVYYTLLQTLILGLTCIWQMRHLRGFFEAKKLV